MGLIVYRSTRIETSLINKNRLVARFINIADNFSYHSTLKSISVDADIVLFCHLEIQNEHPASHVI